MGNWFPWPSGLGGCVTFKHYAILRCEIINCFNVRIHLCTGIWPLLSGAGKSKHAQYVKLYILKSLVVKEISPKGFLGVYHIYQTWPVTTKSSIQSQFSGVHISPLCHSLFNLVTHAQFDSFMGLYIILKDLIITMTVIVIIYFLLGAN